MAGRMRIALNLHANGYRTDASTSTRMTAVRSQNTSPERCVRRWLSEMGLRYRLNRSDLPGKPDIVLAKRKKAIFVHGCFWHRHRGCKRATTPARNVALWHEKFAGNVRRDRRNVNALRRVGWSVLVLWECQLENGRALNRLRRFLAGDGKVRG